MSDVYRMILNELKRRGCEKVDEFAPYYICSAGAHVFNLMNKRRFIYYEHGRVPDMRLHLLLCAPPGFSKTYWLEQFLVGEHAIFRGSGIPVGFEQSMTEAGFVGTVRFVNGDRIEEPGAAKIYRDAILGIEEFSALTTMMTLDYSKMLDTALLTALDSGRVKKRLASGVIEYVTNVTLQCGVQPARYDLTSGLGRRFLFITYIPRKEDFQLLKLARRRGKARKFNPVYTDHIRSEIAKLVSRVNQIEEVEFTEKVYGAFDRLGLVHYEDQLFERLMVGYTVMRGRFGKTLRVDLDKEAWRLLQRAAKARRDVQRGAAYLQVYTILKENGGEADVGYVRERLLLYGLDWEQSSELISTMLRIGLLKRSGSLIRLPGYWR